MPNFYIEIYAFGTTGVSTTGTWTNSTGVANGSTVTITSSATRVGLWITDDDANLNDGSSENPGSATPGANNQVLLYPVTINGITYPAGTRVELEFGFDRTLDGTETALDYYVIRLGGTAAAGDPGTGTNVGVMGTTSDPIGPVFPATSVTYTVENSGTAQDGPSINFLTAACFTHGTMIDTADGARMIEDLTEGDLIATLDHGSQMVRWIGSRHISQIDMMANPTLRPVLFEAGTIGNTRSLLVSPQHRILLSDWRAQVYFGEDQVLVPAKALVNGQTIRQVMPAEGVTYCHLLFDQHEILVTEGALTESFHPSDEGLSMLTNDQQRELDMIFPELVLGTVTRQTAYPVVRVQDARSLRISA